MRAITYSGINLPSSGSTFDSCFASTMVWHLDRKSTRNHWQIIKTGLVCGFGWTKKAAIPRLQHNRQALFFSFKFVKRLQGITLFYFTGNTFLKLFGEAEVSKSSKKFLFRIYSPLRTYINSPAVLLWAHLLRKAIINEQNYESAQNSKANFGIGSY